MKRSSLPVTTKRCDLTTSFAVKWRTATCFKAFLRESWTFNQRTSVWLYFCSLSVLLSVPLSFPPTDHVTNVHRYDRGTTTYDTSEKRRAPAWTDRVLYKEPRAGAVVCASYGACDEMLESDHRPVVARFVVEIPRGRWRPRNMDSETAAELHRMVRHSNLNHLLNAAALSFFFSRLFCIICSLSSTLTTLVAVHLCTVHYFL